MAPPEHSASTAARSDPRAAWGTSRALLVGAAAAATVVAAWVLLTGLTGKTYHLAPPLAALAPGLLLHFEGGAEGRRRALVLATAIGALAVLVGWAIIAAADFDLGSTFIPDQPGGVDGEVLVGGLVGLALGAYLARDRR